MLHKCMYPRCVGQTAKSWVSCPVALHWLIHALNGESVTSKHGETFNLITKKKGFEFKSKLFHTNRRKHQISNIEHLEVNFKTGNAANLIQEWLTPRDIAFSLDAETTKSANYILANLCVLKGKWAQSTADGSFMKVINSFNYRQGVKYEARFLQLPLEEEDLKLLIVLPNETDLLNTLFRRLTNEGLAAAFDSIQPIFTTKSKLDAPLVNFQSQTEICLKDEGIIFDGRAIQYGHANVDHQGLVINILTCIISTTDPPSKQEKVLKETPPFFFAVIHMDSPIITGQFIRD